MNSKHLERIAKTEAVLDAIEAALEEHWNAEVSEPIPEELLNPLSVMERGQQLLSQGLVFYAAQPSTSSVDDEFRAAARNGKPISEAMKSRMHRERKQAEAQLPLTFDE